jgi:sortase (surface protein transpeptidase)
VRPGDLIVLDTPIGTYTYRVDPPFDGHGNPWITNPHDFSVIQPTPEAALTLTTCDPPHTSLNRMIVRATLIQSVLKT